MFTPHSLDVALVMMITSAICWGSWANTYKGVKNYRFELFYWDYAVGIFLISLILALTMGSTSNDANRFLNNVHSADGSNILSAMVGGAIFNLANLLLVAAIDMAGLAIAFPVAIGIALVVGVVLSYILQPRGNGALLAAGVVCAVIAVIMDGKAYGSLASAGRSTSKKSIIVCIVSGVLMGLWAPFVAHAMTQGNTLGPYSIAVFLTLGALLSCSVWNVYFMKRPLVGESVNFSGFFQGPASGHMLGLLGGVIWEPGWSSTWWPRTSREWRFPTPLGSPRPWWLRCGACWHGRNSKVREVAPSCIWSSCLSSIAWLFCWSQRQTADATLGR